MFGEDILNKSAQIYIVDDDVYPRGRATDLQRALNESGHRAQLAKRFSTLKQAFERRQINTEGLIVLDSTLDALVTGEPTVYFGNTVPYLLGQGFPAERIMPASADFENNQLFFILLERLAGYVQKPLQESLMAGIGFDPEEEAKSVARYYESLRFGLAEGRSNRLI